MSGSLPREFRSSSKPVGILEDCTISGGCIISLRKRTLDMKASAELVQTWKARAPTLVYPRPEITLMLSIKPVSSEIEQEKGGEYAPDPSRILPVQSFHCPAGLFCSSHVSPRCLADAAGHPASSPGRAFRVFAHVD